LSTLDSKHVPFDNGYKANNGVIQIIQEPSELQTWHGKLHW
jgi:hypothetical protein